MRWQISRLWTALNTKFVTFVKQFKIDSKTQSNCRLPSIRMFLLKSNLSNLLYIRCNLSWLDKSNFCIMLHMNNIKNVFTSRHSVWVLYVIQNLYIHRLKPFITCVIHVLQTRCSSHVQSCFILWYLHDIPANIIHVLLIFKKWTCAHKYIKGTYISTYIRLRGFRTLLVLQYKMQTSCEWTVGYPNTSP